MRRYLIGAVVNYIGLVCIPNDIPFWQELAAACLCGLGGWFMLTGLGLK